MRIGIMLRHYDQHGGGVKIYTQNLLRELTKLDTGHELVYIYRDPRHVGEYNNGNGQVREVVIDTPQWFPGGKSIKQRVDDFVWDQLATPIAEKKEKLDIIFNPKYSLPLRARCRTVFVCHGLDLYVMPSGAHWFDRFNYYRLLPQYAHKANAIIAVSDTTRQHVIKYLGVDSSRVHTVHLGVGEAFRNAVPSEKLEETRRRYQLPERFFLFCGQIYPPKNFGRLIQAYAQVGPELGIPLVVAGKHTQTNLCGEEIALIERLGISSWVAQPGWIDHQDLPSFYSLADALVMPSLYEACPSPILEAMASGCPIVTANRYGTAELAGDAAILVDPEEIASIADGMRQAATDQDLRERLKNTGRKRVRSFTWEKCAKETLRVLERALANA